MFSAIERSSDVDRPRTSQRARTALGRMIGRPGVTATLLPGRWVAPASEVCQARAIAVRRDFPCLARSMRSRGSRPPIERPRLLLQYYDRTQTAMASAANSGTYSEANFSATLLLPLRLSGAPSLCARLSTAHRGPGVTCEHAVNAPSFAPYPRKLCPLATPDAAASKVLTGTATGPHIIGQHAARSTQHAAPPMYCDVGRPAACATPGAGASAHKQLCAFCSNHLAATDGSGPNSASGEHYALTVRSP
jgi:hypothetical protein